MSSKEFARYIDNEGKLNFTNASTSIFLTAFKKVELFPPMKNLSDNTIQDYTRDLDNFLSFVDKEDMNLSQINVITVQDYQAYLNETVAPRTARRRLGILKRLVTFGYMTGFYNFSMKEWIQNPKVPKYHFSSRNGEAKREIRELSLESAKILINALENVVISKREEHIVLKVRNKILGYFLLTTGMRASEIINLVWNDIFIRKGKYLVEFKGKGSKYRIIPLNENLVSLLFEYRELLGYDDRITDDKRPIFIAFSRNKYQQISYDTLYKLVKKAVSSVSANEHISPHWFRHTFVTTMLEKDVPLAIVKELAGHSSISTTNLYVERMNEDTIQQEYDKVDFDL